MTDAFDIPNARSNYMKLQPGENIFRFLSNPIAGYEYWVDMESGRKPVRVRDGENVPVEHVDSLRFFWIMPVWNHAENKVQILELTQKTVLRPIAALKRNAKWGDLTTYDITIIKTGTTKDDTEYQVIPNPKEELSKKIMDKINAVSINLEVMYASNEFPYGGDPFAVQEDKGVEIDNDEVAKAIGV